MACEPYECPECRYYDVSCVGLEDGDEDRGGVKMGYNYNLDAVKEILRDELEAAVSAVVERYDDENIAAHDAMKTLSDVYCFYSGVMRRMKERDGGCDTPTG